SRQRRHARVRRRVEGTPARPRLNVFRSLTNIYAQVIDDAAGATLVSASSLEPGLNEMMSGKNKTEQAKAVGQVLAERAKEKGIDKVVFDRGGYRYHGRIKALADASREGGLEF
ncbi:MAG: 50S ribosomal protein L18, partial [Caldilineaceae bacterium]|nr:50S ribosomal protein L18 [Caldilineaceae bacterium]